MSKKSEIRWNDALLWTAAGQVNPGIIASNKPSKDKSLALGYANEKDN